MDKKSIELTNEISCWAGQTISAAESLNLPIAREAEVLRIIYECTAPPYQNWSEGVFWQQFDLLDTILGAYNNDDTGRLTDELRDLVDEISHDLYEKLEAKDVVLKPDGLKYCLTHMLTYQLNFLNESYIYDIFYFICRRLGVILDTMAFPLDKDESD